MDKHTPTPWTAETRDWFDPYNKFMVPGAVVRGSEPNVPSYLQRAIFTTSGLYSHADAVLIVEAVNSYDRLRRDRDALLASCKTMVGRIEDGTLVRDISKYASPEWAMKMLAFVKELQDAQLAIAAAEVD